jgi:hypothetical protein
MRIFSWSIIRTFSCSSIRTFSCSSIWSFYSESTLSSQQKVVSDSSKVKLRAWNCYCTAEQPLLRLKRNYHQPVVVDGNNSSAIMYGRSNGRHHRKLSSYLITLSYLAVG